MIFVKYFLNIDWLFFTNVLVRLSNLYLYEKYFLETWRCYLKKKHLKVVTNLVEEQSVELLWTPAKELKLVKSNILFLVPT